MKNNIKFFLGLFLGLLITGFSAYAAIAIQASEIGYKNGTVESALNDLYSKANNTKKTCLFVSGSPGQVSAKYLCDLGDGVARYFYILAVNGSNVKMIMEKSLSNANGSSIKMIYDEAIAYFEEGHPGYSIKESWKYANDIDIPTGPDIASAANMSSWDVSTATNDPGYYNFGGSTYSDSSKRSNYKWLYNYTAECSSYGCDSSTSLASTEPHGYWTKSKVSDNNARVWRAGYKGYFATVSVNNTDTGLRPVVTISASQLSN